MYNFTSILKLLAFVALLGLSCQQDQSKSDQLADNPTEIPPTAIQIERSEMHEEFANNVKYLKLEKKLKHLSKKSFDECSFRQAEKRIQYSWRLGNVEQLKEDIPLFMQSKHYADPEYSKLDWRRIIHMWEHVPSEWAHFSQMVNELYLHFKKTGNLQAEQNMLGAKIQGAHLMGDTLSELRYLKQMIREIGSEDERYKTYLPMLGWWYQDHGQWDKSVEVFRTEYERTNSTNMLSSLVWGLFNTGEFEKVIGYESKALKINEKKIDYLLAKSFEELGQQQKAARYYTKFSDNRYLGSRVDRYFTDRNDNKFYLSDHSYLIDIADHFSVRYKSYSCELYKHIYDMMLMALNSDYSVSLERKVILAQDDPKQQEIQEQKYQTRRKSLFKELRFLRDKCEDCVRNGLISSDSNKKPIVFESSY